MENGGTRRQNGLGTVVVAESDAQASSVADLLDEAGYGVVLARDGHEALEVVRRAQPVLVVLDVGLPGLSGYEVCRALKDEFGEAMPVILVSGSRTEPFDRAAGLLIGADDYVTKPFDDGELLARARRCIVRAALIDATLNGAPPSNTFGLSAREEEVLTLLVDGLGTKEIALELFISRKTVATHIQRILAKLGAHSRGEAIAIAHRAHLVDRVEVEAHLDLDSLALEAAANGA